MSFMDYGPDWPPAPASKQAVRPGRALLRRMAAWSAFYVAAFVVGLIALSFRGPMQLHDETPRLPQQQSGPMWHKTVPDPIKETSR